MASIPSSMRRPTRNKTHHKLPPSCRITETYKLPIQHTHSSSQKAKWHLSFSPGLTNHQPAVIPLHPVVPNPYTLLSLIPPNTTYYFVLNLKDTFFTIPLQPDFQNLTFTWTDPDTHISQQLTWAVYPKDFKTVPTFLGYLARDLKATDLSPSALLQHVDDLLLRSLTL